MLLVRYPSPNLLGTLFPHDLPLTPYAEVHPKFKAATISGKYMVQYSFGAIGVGSTVPMIEAVGVGWTFTFGEFPQKFLRQKLLSSDAADILFVSSNMFVTSWRLLHVGYCPVSCPGNAE